MPDTRKSPLIPLVIAAVAVLALVALFIGSRTSDSDGAEPSGSAAADVEPRPDSGATDALDGIARRDPGDPMAKGPADAPVVMVNYSEFQCPFCGKFARDTAPALEEKYVEDGTLRIEWRDFPYLGPESTTAAQAGRAAAAQGQFWEFHDAMFADQLPPNSGHLDDDYVIDIADEIGLDVAQFRADLNSKATQAAVAEDFEEGQQIGVTGTPAFLINGEPVVGAQPTEVFEAAIERAAAADHS